VNGSVTLDKSGHDVSIPMPRERGKEGNVETESSQRCPRRGWRLGLRHHIGQPHQGHALVGLLAVEKVGKKFDDTRHTSGTTDQDDFMDL
jgi:hypothetical protein